MTCQECELRLALDQNVDEHLSACSACRALAEEMRANAAAFESLAADPLPPVRHKVMTQIRAQSRNRQLMRWGWALAAAAMLAVAIFLSTHPRAAAPAPQMAQVEMPRPMEVPRALPAHEPPLERSSVRKPEILKVKMFTDDPDVVIYWLVDKKEGTGE